MNHNDHYKVDSGNYESGIQFGRKKKILLHIVVKMKVSKLKQFELLKMLKNSRHQREQLIYE